jgi:rubrerythrin
VPEFVNPFSGKVPDRLLTREELIRAIRLDISAEHEAVHLYMAHAEAVDDPLAKAVLIDIANEERVHIGEFGRLLQILSGDEDQWAGEGVAEVDGIAAQLASSQEAPAAPAPASGADGRPGAHETGAGSTLGSLRG